MKPARPVCPWDFSIPDTPDTGVPNLPSPQGAELGRELARLTDAAEAEALAQFPNQLPRCDDCAFRLGTPPNRSTATLMDALKCVVEGVPFYCHKGVDEDKGRGPTRLCGGWVSLAGKGVT